MNTGSQTPDFDWRQLMNYIGEQCFYCGKNFEDGDDIVVCPECGTPYHRECYKQAGECINHQLHESGKGWERKAVQENEQKSKAEKICPRCRCRNEHNAMCCRQCGAPLTDGNGAYPEQSENSISAAASIFTEIDPNSQYLGFNPDEDFGGAKLKEVSQFVSSNTLYYIPLFKRMKDFGSKISFNMVCLFFPYFYFANRKMWLWAVLTALLSTLLNIPNLIYIIGDQMTLLPIMQDVSGFINNHQNILITLGEICNAADWILKMLTCLFGNWLYMRFSVRSINRVKNFYGGPVSPQKLQSKGGVQPANILIMALILIGMTAALYFLIMIILMFVQQAGLI